MHLLYSRFFTKAVRDMGVVELDEPCMRLFNQGMILGPDGQRMSKSRGNVVAPDDQVSTLGRRHVPRVPDVPGPVGPGRPVRPERHQRRAPLAEPRLERRDWPTCRRRALPDAPETRELRRWTHKTIARVTDDMEVPLQHDGRGADGVHELPDEARASPATPSMPRPGDEAIETLALLLAPSAPHIAEELWARIGQAVQRAHAGVAEADAALAATEQVEIAVQVNGKVRDRLLLRARRIGGRREGARRWRARR